VVNRFGISLGFGEKTVKTVCTEQGIDGEFFLTILNAFSNENYFPQKTLQTFNVLTIVNYLRKTHSYYIETQVPIIEGQINTLMRRSSKRNRTLRLVKKFFLEYKKELLAHLKREETITFPHIVRVYGLYHSKGSAVPEEILSRYSMKVYEEEHDNVDDKLYDLKNILIKYIHGEFDETVCNAIIFELFRLEKDIKDHTRIEENILRPVVIEMEKKLHSRAA
jgi:regulator of cell morphogenesis and NO signaling